MAVGKPGQEGIACRLLAVHDRGVAEAKVHDGRHRDPLQRAVDDFDRITFGGLWVIAQPGFIELDDIRSGGLQVQGLGVDGGGQVHRHFLVILVELVLGLLCHREGAGQRDLGGEACVASQKFHVTALDRFGAAQPRHHPRHQSFRTVSRADHAGLVVVHALQRGRESVRIALATHLSVGDDVDAGSLHVAYGQ